MKAELSEVKHDEGLKGGHSVCQAAAPYLVASASVIWEYEEAMSVGALRLTKYLSRQREFGASVRESVAWASSAAECRSL